MSIFNYNGSERVILPDKKGSLVALAKKHYIGKNPKRWRAFAVILLETYGLSYSEIGAAMGLHRSHVGRCSRATKQAIASAVGADALPQEPERNIAPPFDEKSLQNPITGFL